MENKQIDEFQNYLYGEDKSLGTIEKYTRDVQSFFKWLDGKHLTKESGIKWRDFLVERGYAYPTINSMIAAVNTFLKFLGRGAWKIKFLKVQRRIFRPQEKELTQKEYKKLLNLAYGSGQERLGLLMETICGTGIRVSEVKYITAEAVKKGRTEINLKGKIRTILLPKKLKEKLVKYMKKQKIVSGEIFLTRNGRSLSRKQIWAEMKRLCKRAGVQASKVFPHNLRHLFAQIFHKTFQDIVKLADILGHSSLNTTRLYLVTTSKEHIKCLDQMHLIL